MYQVKEMFYSLQGEGAQTGRPAMFVRFVGCNLWTGKESHRATAVCQFCDTDFLGTDGVNGGKFKTAEALAAAVLSLWPQGNAEKPYVICTGGEPALQIDAPLITAFHNNHFEIAIETNGTLPLPAGIDWICVSPKGKSVVVLTGCDELKLVYPQTEAMPEKFAHIVAKYRYLSPKNPYDTSSIIATDISSTQLAIAYCLANPQWRLTLQTHKIIHIA